MTGTWGAPDVCEAIDPAGERCGLPAGHPGNHMTSAQLAAAAPVAISAGMSAPPPTREAWSPRRKVALGGAATFVILAAIGSVTGGGEQPTPSHVPAAFVNALSTPATSQPRVATPAPVQSPTPLATEAIATPSMEPSATPEPSPEPTEEPVATDTPAAFYTPPGWDGVSDVNCKDFQTHKQAVSFFVGTGGTTSNDPYGLDGNHDGNPCQSLP